MTNVTPRSNDILDHLARSMPGSLVSMLDNGELCVGYPEPRFESVMDVMAGYLESAVKGYFGIDCHTRSIERGPGRKVILDYSLTEKGIPQLNSSQRKVTINVQGLTGIIRIEGETN